MKLYSAVLCGIVIFLAGCHADLYYQERAVERARTFLLKNARDLTPEELAYVRLNDPVLLHGDVLVASATGELNTDLHQICVTWIIPGKKELYMVYGVSTGRMAFWYPERIVKRVAFKKGIPWQSAVDSVVKYATDNLYDYLTAKEMNQIRFANPWLMQTGFELNLETVSNSGDAKVPKKTQKMKQYSLVWKFDGKSLVFAGFNPPWKGGWNILFAAFVSDEELKKATVKVIASPDDLQSIVVKDDEDEEGTVKDKKSASESKKEGK